MTTPQLLFVRIVLLTGTAVSFACAVINQNSLCLLLGTIFLCIESRIIHGRTNWHQRLRGKEVVLSLGGVLLLLFLVLMTRDWNLPELSPSVIVLIFTGLWIVGVILIFRKKM